MPPSGKPRVLQGVRLAPDPAAESTSRRLPEKQAEALQADRRSSARDVSLVELTQRYGLTLIADRIACEEGAAGARRTSSSGATRRSARIEQQRVTLSEDQQARGRGDHAARSTRAHIAGICCFGVTASGKTEVYLRCIERALELGKTSLVLLPEIALTTQVMNIFKSRFGRRGRGAAQRALGGRAVRRVGADQRGRGEGRARREVGCVRAAGEPRARGRR